METTEVRNLRRDEGRWLWEVANEDGSVSEFRTDANGEGLWQWGVWGGDISPTWKQHLGHLQFSLPDSLPAALAKVKYHHNRPL